MPIADFLHDYPWSMGLLERFAQTVLVADALVIVANFIDRRVAAGSEPLSVVSSLTLPLGVSTMVAIGFVLNIWAMLRALHEVLGATRPRTPARWLGYVFVGLLFTAALSVPVHAIRYTG